MGVTTPFTDPVTGESGDQTTHNPPESRFKPAWEATQQGAQRSDPTYRIEVTPDLRKDPVFRYVSIQADGSVGALENVEAATWNDVNAILTGTITLRDEVYAQTDRPHLDQGDRVVCEVNEGAGYSELWTMRSSKPQLTASTLQRQFNLVNDLDLLRRSEISGPISYKATRKRPHGYLGHEVILDVCRLFKVPVGQMYTSTLRMQPLYKNRTSPLEIIRNVVLKERRHGRRLVVSFDRGALSVTPLRRGEDLLKLGPQLLEAAFSSDLREEFASALTVHARSDLIFNTDLKGKRKAKIQKGHVEVESPASVRRFGYVHRVVFSPDANTDAMAREEGETYLAAIAKPVKTVVLTTKGIPRIRRGDAIRIGIGDDAFRQQICYVIEAAHSHQPGNYTTAITVSFEDPYIDQRSMTILNALKGDADVAVTLGGNAYGKGSPQKNDTPNPPPTSGPFTMKPLP